MADDVVELYVEKRFAGRRATAKCLATFKEAGIERVSDLNMFNYDELQKLGVPPLFIKLMQRDGLLQPLSPGAASQSHFLGVIGHMVDEKLADIFRVATHTDLTLGLKDELLGASIMSRPDYDHSREGLIVQTFAGVDVSGKLDAFKESLRASFEEGNHLKKRKLSAQELSFDGEKKLQRGVSQGFAQLQAPGSWFFDTSQGGVLFSQDKPDCIFSSCQYVVSWLCAVMVGELSWELDGADSGTKRCVGKIVARLRKIISTQKGRKVVFGFIADRRAIQFVGLDVSGGEETFWWSQEYAFHLEATDDSGFRLLLQMIYADQSVHGYVTLLGTRELRLDDGRCIQHLTAVSSKGDSHILVGTLDGDGAVVVKLCRVMEVEVQVLSAVQGVSGILPLLAHGKWFGRHTYIVTPLCRTVDEPVLHRPCREYVKMLQQVAETLKLLSDRGIYHGDVSASNVVYNDTRYYLIDFGSAVSCFTPDDERTGVTRLFAAVQVLDGNEHCLSSEMESLMYVLVYLAMGRRVPWRFSGANIVSMYKRALFSNVQTFEQRVVSHVDDKLLQEQLRRLQKLFFVPTYRHDVRYEEFCQELLLDDAQLVAI
ncbi:hypothetical protein SELMODRAFT_404331 [Selaginella moellendorffii]|uniref:Protein kinase domain-containing protein n=1 Tax=Selaginella moellendorffii TaxID=88036 RepID=D8QV02_SELML|nr:hypothetical protein SELMODRAFT_404331 [Selaginella moellendorffii]